MSRPLRRLPLVLALAAALTLPLAACSNGVDDGGSPTTTGSPSASAGSPSASSGAPSTGPHASASASAGGGGTSSGEGGVGGAAFTQAEYDTAVAEVERLPLEALAGQLIVTHYVGQTPEKIADLVRREHLGGVITFADNVPPQGQRVEVLRRTHELVQQAVRDDGRDWPAMIGVDQEGGPVARLGAPLTEFGPAMALGAQASGRVRLAEAEGRASGAELRALGYTMVFAPDADVTVGAQDPTIGARSPSSDPATVSEVTTALTKGYTAAGIVSAPKHFPGHGSLTTDSHVGMPVQARTLEQLRSTDLAPFGAAVTAGTPMVMVGHINVPELDDLPASLSPAVIDGLLRDDLGYGGLVVTDALNMGAIVEQYGVDKVAVMAVQAGVDVLLMPTNPVAARDALVAAVEAGTLERSRLEQSAARIVATMRATVGDQPGTEVVGAAAHSETAEQIAAGAVTVVGSCTAAVVDGPVAVSGGTESDRARFAAAAQAGGLAVSPAGTPVRLLEGARYNAAAPEAVEAAPSAGADGAGAGSGVVVALDVPYPLAKLGADEVGVATFGRTPAHFAALVDVLTGRTTAPGRLPVPVGTHALGASCTR